MELQNKFHQNQNGEINQLLNNFDNGNSFNHLASDDFYSQQLQIGNSRVENYENHFVEQMRGNRDNHTEFVFETYLKQREKQNQFPTCDEPKDNPTFTQSNDFQITTFESENKNLNEVVNNAVIDLNFNSFEGEEITSQFDLPFSEHDELLTTNLELENEKCIEVVNNLIKEDDFCEQEILRICENELLHSNTVDLNHHLDVKINNFDEFFKDELEFINGENNQELQPLIKSTVKIIEKKTIHAVINKTTFVFPNQHSIVKSFINWFSERKLCLSYTKTQMHWSLEDRFIYFLTVYFLMYCEK